MKTLVVAAIRCCLMFPLPTVTYAISAQWDLDPISGDWNTAANWTPNGVPNGAADIATFALSNTTLVSISADTEVNGIIFTPAATNPYTIILNPGITLTLSGAGIRNNSGIRQLFFVGDPNDGGRMHFTNGASAGNASINLNSEGSINFFNRSTADSAFISCSESFCSLNFFNTSTAGSARIDFAFGVRNSITFSDNSTAGSAILAAGEQDVVRFLDHSTAGNATIIGGPIVGLIGFHDSSSAGSAIIDVNGAELSFLDSSKGATAAIRLFVHHGLQFPSSLDISRHNTPGVTIGSLEGDETAIVTLGANNLTVGSNNLSTAFSGVIQDGGQGGGAGGSLTKIGTGTLELTGANTYTGNTNVNRGVLQVDGSITATHSSIIGARSLVRERSMAML